MMIFATVFGAVAVATASAPVASGYPVWTGTEEANHVLGRLITPSDLRHRVVLVCEFQAEQVETQFTDAWRVVSSDPRLASSGALRQWEHEEPDRRALVLYSNRGRRDPQAIKAACGGQGHAQIIPVTETPVYDGVTFKGAPDAEGKYPFYYVMGPEGTQPLYKGWDWNAAVRAVWAAKDKLPIWKPFLGTVDADASADAKAVWAAYVSGKPMEPLSKKLLKSIGSVSSEDSRTAQILYDAIWQARGDLLFRISLEYLPCPHRATYDMDRLIRWFPAEKLRLKPYREALKKKPQMTQFTKHFIRIMEMSDPNNEIRNVGAARKAKVEAQKIRKAIEPMKNQTEDSLLQGAAMYLESDIDRLVGTLNSVISGNGGK